jgi:hypothetical protein
VDTTATHAGVAACLVTRAIAPATESLVPAWGSGSRTGTATLRSSPEGITRRTNLPLLPSTGTSCATSRMGRQCTSLSTSGKPGPGEPRGSKKEGASLRAHRSWANKNSLANSALCQSNTQCVRASGGAWKGGGVGGKARTAATNQSAKEVPCPLSQPAGPRTRSMTRARTHAKRSSLD